MKKLLFTIIILGACLVGSSQNWDSVKVGNFDVDSIMLGGAKIWEKPNSEPPVYDSIEINYSGVLVSGLEVGEYWIDVGYASRLAGSSLTPQNDTITQISIPYYTSDGAENEGVISLNCPCIANSLMIDSVEYDVSFNSFTTPIGVNPFPVAGEPHDIDLKYYLYFFP